MARITRGKEVLLPLALLTVFLFLFPEFVAAACTYRSTDTWPCEAANANGHYYWGGLKNREYRYKLVDCNTGQIYGQGTICSSDGTNRATPTFYPPLGTTVKWIADWYDCAYCGEGSSLSCVDNDRDNYGYSCSAGMDCDDTRNTVYPGATEVCNSRDDNCNLQIDEGNVCAPTCTDTDRDGYAAQGGSCGTADCNDNNAAVNPGAAEICDSVDNNCNGQVDENNVCTPADPDIDLLEKYSPVLVMHPNEWYFPKNVESMVRQSSLWKIPLYDPTGVYAPVQVIPPYQVNVQDLEGKDELYYLDLEKHYAENIILRIIAGIFIRPWKTDPLMFVNFPANIYGRVNRVDPNSIVLQYWIFYPFNDWDFKPLAISRLLNSAGKIYTLLAGVAGTPFQILGAMLTFFETRHEGDWELVQVLLDRNEQPIKVALSQHDFGKTHTWGEMELLKGTHPKIYVALGDHVSYKSMESPVAIELLGNEIGILDDISAEGIKFISKALHSTLSPTELNSLTGVNANYYDPPYQQVPPFAYDIKKIDDATNWVRFMGRWGIWNRGLNPGGPYGPANQDMKWSDPLAWSRVGELSIWDQMLQRIVARLTGKSSVDIATHSPVNIHAYDSQGRHVGLNAGGGIDAEIPGTVMFIPTENDVEVIGISTEDEMTFTIEATANGQFNATISKYENNTNTTIAAEYNEIPITAATEATVTVSDTSDFAMSIDTNGDGTTDQTITPDAFTCTGSNCLTAPTEQTIPSDKDSWTESLQRWKITGKDKLELSTDKMVGSYSIKTTNALTGSGQKRIDLLYTLEQPLDLATVEEVRFWLKVPTGTSSVTLYLNPGARFNSAQHLSYKIYASGQARQNGWVEFKIPITAFMQKGTVKSIQSFMFRVSNSVAASFSIFADGFHFFLPGTPTTQPTPETTIGLWHMDETSGTIVADSGPFKIDGQVVGTSSIVPGKAGNARQFSGNGYILLGDRQELRPENIFVEAWVKTTSTAPMGVFVTGRVQFGSGTSAKQYGIALTVSNGIPSIEVGTGAATGISILGQNAINDGNWHFFRGSYRKTSDGNYALIFSVDGTLQGEAAGNGPILYATGYKESTIGARKYGSNVDWRFNGAIDEVKVST